MIAAAPLLAAVLAAAAALQPPAAAAPAKPSRPPCILLSNGTDTEYVPVDDHTIVVRSISRWWKLTTTPSSYLDGPHPILVNDIHGSSTLCSPLDFELSVLDHPGGGREGLIVQDFQSITSQEGWALRRVAHR